MPTEPLRITNVAVPVADGVAPFELGIACELFGLDRSDQGLPRYEFGLASVPGGPVRTTAGYQVATGHGLDRLADADLIVLVAGAWVETGPDPALVAHLYAARDRGAHLMAICRGAFVLAAAGLLDGLPATTHWRWTAELGSRYPKIRLDPGVLYVDAGAISTSAGTAAGIDLGLHLLRRAHGAAVAAEVARRMVVPPHRDGGQAQYLRAPLPAVAAADPLQDAITWAMGRLDQPIAVADLAREARLAPRTFARLFRHATGTTPHRWLTSQRVDLVRELLETTDQTIEALARVAGFGSVDTLRAQFTRQVGAAPAQYRRTFGMRRD
ncbi:helix-turn-helix domain-containing protein [Asanoa sp. NPDC049573]|uniref:GlxA family transcriptional regulator n=1 Tax=Asanoa sp. NPDC049573 TaxID=3155396 RepID=UPI003414E050